MTIVLNVLAALPLLILAVHEHHLRRKTANVEEEQ